VAKRLPLLELHHLVLDDILYVLGLSNVVKCFAFELNRVALKRVVVCVCELGTGRAREKSCEVGGFGDTLFQLAMRNGRSAVGVGS
jgi:hypothetical protein